MPPRPKSEYDIGRLLDLMEEWQTRKDAGLSPRPIDLCPDDPAMCKRLERAIEAAKVLDEAAGFESTMSQKPVGPAGGAAAAPSKSPNNAGGFAPPSLRLIEELGRGAMGVVYSAWQVGTNRKVAYKLGHERLKATKEAARFVAEAKAVAAVDHSGVVKVFEAGEHNGRPYIVMELLTGGTLADKLRPCGKSGPVVPLEANQAARLLWQLALAVQAVHDQGIVHRDLKPSNVLFDADGRPKVVDFGLAKQDNTPDDLTETGDAIGSPAYMSPEQAGGQAKFVGPTADVWALGVVLYECLSGTRPFGGVNRLQLYDAIRATDPPPPTGPADPVPRDLQLICLKCLRKDPAERYSTAGAFAQDLERFLTHRPVEARPVRPAVRVLKLLRRNGALLTVTAALAVAAGVSSWFAVEAGRNSRAAELARRQADDDRRMILNSLLKITDPLVSRGFSGPTPLRPDTADVIRHATELYASTPQHLQDAAVDPPTRVRWVLRIGQMHHLLNDTAAASRHVDQARRLIVDLSTPPPDLVGEVHFAVAVLRPTADATVLAELTAAKAAFETALSAAPNDPRLIELLAWTYRQLAASHARRPEGRRAAETELRAAIALVSPWAGQTTAPSGLLDVLAESRMALADLLEPPDSAEVEAELRAVLTLSDDARHRDAVAIRRRERAATAAERLGQLFWTRKQPAAAEAQYRHAIAHLAPLAAAFSDVPRYGSALLRNRSALADVLQHLGRTSDAVRELQSAEATAGEFGPDADALRAVVLRKLIGFERTTNPPTALLRANEVVVIEKRRLAAAADKSTVRPAMAESYTLLAELLHAAGRPAEEAIQSAVDQAQRHLKEVPSAAARRLLARTLWVQVTVTRETNPTQQANVLEKIHDLLADAPDQPSDWSAEERALRVSVLHRLIDVRLDAKLHERAAALSMELSSVAVTAQDHLETGVLFSRCAELVKADNNLTAEDKLARTEAFARQALGALKRAVADGFAEPYLLDVLPELQSAREEDDYPAVREAAARNAANDR